MAPLFASVPSTIEGREDRSSRQETDRSISIYWIFSILLVPRLLAAQYAIIGDCDEGT